MRKYLGNANDRLLVAEVNQVDSRKMEFLRQFGETFGDLKQDFERIVWTTNQKCERSWVRLNDVVWMIATTTSSGLDSSSLGCRHNLIYLRPTEQPPLYWTCFTHLSTYWTRAYALCTAWNRESWRLFQQAEPSAKPVTWCHFEALDNHLQFLFAFRPEANWSYEGRMILTRKKLTGEARRPKKKSTKQCSRTLLWLTCAFCLSPGSCGMSWKVCLFCWHFALKTKLVHHPSIWRAH